VAAGDLDLNGRADLIVSAWQLDDPSVPADEFKDVGKTFVFYAPEPRVTSLWLPGLGMLFALARLQRRSDGGGQPDEAQASLRSKGRI